MMDPLEPTEVPIDFRGQVPVGTKLNGIYKIDEWIAQGGMGEIYRGHNLETSDKVAIKIILPESAKDDMILALFRREASMLSHLSHQSIVKYHIFTKDPELNRHYLAMEFIDGQSLADRIKEGPIDVDEAKQIFIDIALGLEAAHEEGIIHRDLSPDNIVLINREGKTKVKIIDFGIAKSTKVLTTTILGERFAGKPNFVSPEQLGRFKGEITERSDIYSLGLVFAAALLGKTIDMGGSLDQILDKRSSVPDISKISSKLRPVITAMLQPDPDNRPQSMTAVVEGMVSNPVPFLKKHKTLLLSLILTILISSNVLSVYINNPQPEISNLDEQKLVEIIPLNLDSPLRKITGNEQKQKPFTTPTTSPRREINSTQISKKLQRRLKPKSKFSASQYFEKGLVAERGNYLQDAVKFYKKSAAQGSIRAMNYLGIMYRHGQGVTKSKDEALVWFRKAADKGSKYARKQLN